jgi:hypothetical protein
VKVDEGSKVGIFEIKRVNVLWLNINIKMDYVKIFYYKGVC